LVDGSEEISWTPFLLLLPNQPKPFFSAAFDLEEWAFALWMLPEDCDVAEDDRLAVSSSFALLAFLAPTVSACWGGTSKVGNMSTCQCGPIVRQGGGFSWPAYLQTEIRVLPSIPYPSGVSVMTLHPDYCPTNYQTGYVSKFRGSFVVRLGGVGPSEVGPMQASTRSDMPMFSTSRCTNR
jgi:hypothetical protein